MWCVLRPLCFRNALYGVWKSHLSVVNGVVVVVVVVVVWKWGKGDGGVGECRQLTMKQQVHGAQWEKQLESLMVCLQCWREHNGPVQLKNVPSLLREVNSPM